MNFNDVENTITIDSKKLDASFFTPYDTNFAQNRFYFIDSLNYQISNVEKDQRGIQLL